MGCGQKGSICHWSFVICQFPFSGRLCRALCGKPLSFPGPTSKTSSARLSIALKVQVIQIGKPEAFARNAAEPPRKWKLTNEK